MNESSPPRSGLTRAKAARQIPNLDSTKHLIVNQKKSLARLARQSMRSGRNSSYSVASSGPPSQQGSIRENGPDNLLPPIETVELLSPSTNTMLPSTTDNSLSSDRVSRSRVQSRSKRDSSFSLDELSVEVLCMHVAELMGGPAIPKASFIPHMETIQDSMKFDPEGFGDDGMPFANSSELGPPSRNPSNFDIGAVNVEMQLQEMQRIEAAKAKGHETNSFPDAKEGVIDEEEACRPSIADLQMIQENHTAERIEVSPGEFLPLYGCAQAFESLMAGKMTVTTCLGCNTDLMVVPTADLVVCSDCWLFSPVIKYGPNGEQLEDCMPIAVGMGVTGEDVKEWLEDGYCWDGST